MSDTTINGGATSRRNFLTGAGLVAGSVGLTGAVGARASASELSMPGEDPEVSMVYQVNRDDPDYYGHILFSMGEILRQTANNAALTAVCFGPGLNLLRAQRSESVSAENHDRIASLMTYGASFRACRQSMDAMDLAPEDLIDGVEVVPSGVLKMARLQQEGAAYVAW